MQSCREFLGRVESSLSESEVQQRFDTFSAQFNEYFCGSTNGPLVWFPGKDLMAAMEGWLQGAGYANAGVFCAELRNRVKEHPEEALAMLPEWGAFVHSLKQ